MSISRSGQKVCTGLACHLLHEEVVHAAVVVGRRQDVQGVVLPLGGLQGDAADLHTATPPHFRRRLLVLLTVPDPPGGGCLQVRTVRRRGAFWDTKREEQGLIEKIICDFVKPGVKHFVCDLYCALLPSCFLS